MVKQKEEHVAGGEGEGEELSGPISRVAGPTSDMMDPRNQFEQRLP